MTNDEKLFYHLAIWPFLDLRSDFDPAPFLAEAQKNLDAFKLHRGDYQDMDLLGHWKEFEPIISEDHFLKNCLDLSRPSKIRHMLLEAHSKILPHRDSTDRPLYVIHACLSYPKGCRFTVGIDANGNHNLFSEDVPFAAGKVFLINTSSFHSVENTSEENRFHLVALGSFKLSVDQLLKLAEEQNGQKSEDELLRLFTKMKLVTTSAESVGP